LGDVRVIAVGTTVFTVTNADGRYTCGCAGRERGNSGAQGGVHEQKKPVTIPAGGSVTVDFVLTRAVIVLREVVTTATATSAA
jgi:hypothetical protein